jgi:hypothetical protein
MRDTVAEFSKSLPENIISKLNEIIDIKSQGLEKDTVLNIPIFDEFFKKELAKNYSSFNKREIDRPLFDRYLQTCLGL